MFLRVVDETNLGLEVLAPLLIPELANMAAGFAGLATIPSFDDFCPGTECSIASFAGNQSRVLVSEQAADLGGARVGVLLFTSSTRERLRVESPEITVSYPCARGQDKF